MTKTYYEVVSGESIAARPKDSKAVEEVNAGLYAGVLVVDLVLARGNSADQAYISQVFQFWHQDYHSLPRSTTPAMNLTRIL